MHTCKELPDSARRLPDNVHPEYGRIVREFEGFIYSTPEARKYTFNA